MFVTKSSGITEPFDITKIEKVLNRAVRDTRISVAQVIELVKPYLVDGMTTKQIQQTVVSVCSSNIENYHDLQYVAARMKSYALRKQVYGQYEPPKLSEIIETNVNKGVYDTDLLTLWTQEELDYLDSKIVHKRDNDFSYAGLMQFVDKYLVKNRKTKEIFETPQFSYMLIAMCLHQSEDKTKRLQYVVDYYEAISTQELSLPTPILAGVRTPTRQFSSCTKIESGDSLKSINATSEAIVNYVAKRAGIGVNGGMIRAEGSQIRSGEVVHTGLIPFWKHFQTAVGSSSQGGVRKGSATMNYPMWHLEFENLIVLKNNKGVDENRIRHIDYCVHINETMFKRLINNDYITLFSPHVDNYALYKAFYSGDSSKFEEIYERLEKTRSLYAHKRIRALDMFSALCGERASTGRIYTMFVDNVNKQTPYKEPIKMTNLCVSGDTMLSVKINDRKDEITMQKMVELYERSPNIKIDVLSYNIKSGISEFKRVTAAAMTAKNAKTMKITYNGKSVVCTPDHQILTKNRGYVMAKDLVCSDELVDVDASFNGSMLSIEPHYDDMDVYDITVKDNHNFYANGLVVHNCVEINLPTKPLGEIESVRVFVENEKDADLLTSYNRLSKMPSDLESLYSELPSSTHNIPVVIELDVGEISLCTLAAYNLGRIESPARFEELAKIAIRGLDNLLDYQDYPSVYALAAKKRRALGIGVTDYAHFLAKNFVKYTDKSARKLTHEWFEAMSFYNINASCELARERGKNEWHHKTKWHEGILPIDTYNKNVDELVAPNYKLDWDRLRFKVLEYGMRHDTLSALMPCESSSVVSNSTNGIEPPRSIVSAKQNKDGVYSQVLPEADALAPMYELAWETAKNGGFLDLVAIMQKFVDQGISVNTYHNPELYPNKKLPLMVMLRELAFCQKYGIKSLYYHNTNDGSNTDLDESDCAGCKI